MKSGRSITAPDHQLSHRYMPTTPDEGNSLPAHQSITAKNDPGAKGNPNRSSGSIPQDMQLPSNEIEVKVKPQGHLAKDQRKNKDLEPDSTLKMYKKSFKGSEQLYWPSKSQSYSPLKGFRPYIKQGTEQKQQSAYNRTAMYAAGSKFPVRYTAHNRVSTSVQKRPAGRSPNAKLYETN